MNTENTIAKIGKNPPPNVLRLKAPITMEHRRWIAAELDNYIVSIQYLAFFFEMRSKLGDMTEQEVWDEVKQNVSMAARDGYDVLGVQ